jgi:biopolymer transport protein ExbD
MGKGSGSKESLWVDMTAMCDVAFLLLTFFILTSKFKVEQPVEVFTPSSVSEVKLPETDIMMITVSDDGRIFFDMDGQFKRMDLINKIDEKYSLNLTDQEKTTFSLGTSFGVPIGSMKQYLSLPVDERKAVRMSGIPSDSTNNELSEWILYGRMTNPKIRIAIKADKDASYPVVGKVIKTLQERNINKFNLITDMEIRPEI